MSDPKELTNAELAEAIRAQPDCDICAECGEHADFDEQGSTCCGARPIDTDPDVDMER